VHTQLVRLAVPLLQAPGVASCVPSLTRDPVWAAHRHLGKGAGPTTQVRLGRFYLCCHFICLTSWEFNVAMEKMSSSNHPERAPRDKEHVILPLEGTDAWSGRANGTQGRTHLPHQKESSRARRV